MTVAVILAGGLGTRLRDAVPDVPKPMAPVRERPFLEHLMSYWADQKVSKFVLLVSYMHEVISAHFGAEYQGVPVEYAVEDEPLGTGGGLLRLSKTIGDAPFVVINGDTFFEVDLKDLLDFHASHEADWSLALFRSTEAGRYMEIELDDDGRIDTGKALSKGDMGKLANGGVYVINPAVLRKASAGLPDQVSLEDQVLPYVGQAGGRVFGVEFDGIFIDIGVPRDFHRAAEVLPDL